MEFIDNMTAMDLMRSEKMSYIQLIIPIESAYRAVSYLGELGLLQFQDLNADNSPFQRTFVNQVKRCGEMSRKLRFFKDQISKAGIVSLEHPVMQPDIELEELEIQLTEHEHELIEMNFNGEQLWQTYSELLEFKMVLDKVSRDELMDFLTSQQEGPIVHVHDSVPPRAWTKFMQLNKDDKLQHMKRIVESQRLSMEEGKEDELEKSWSWRKLLMSLFGSDDAREDGGRRRGKAPDSYNLYDRKPDFRNNYGWSVALHQSDYEPLRHSGIGIYLVNLTAGSMMAPHVNPTATEYGIVLRGSGTVQIAYPNGSSAMKAKVREGDVFWVPRYFPFCQTSSQNGPFEFFGFTTSAKKNRPQFLAGQNSLLHVLSGPELAASLGITDERMRSFLDAQREAVILPSSSLAPPKEMQQEKEKEKRRLESRGVGKVAASIANEMVVGLE
ncbi:hypothetical protein SAY87_016291 [Trapa incisa]|uniref:Cupin type-1 domain-containing protein n=1 Tax=Trapa incisa TaxID=236973 RepID=A0AAN7QXY1_9MYRT|nr:hypothetical protein SAY87_016291 [Trapa incisa]